MREISRIGGIAALVASATFVVGFVLFGTVLADYTTGDPTPAESVEFLVDNTAVLRLWYIVIFIVFGIALVPVAIALYHQLRAAPVLAQTATAFGLIWAALMFATGMVANIGIGTIADLEETDPTAAEPVWSALDSVQNGLGGGNEIVGGLWVLLLSWAALQTGALSRGLNYLGAVAGIAGLVTIIPVLEPVGAIFGLGLIVWFIWLGIMLIRQTTSSDPSSHEPSRPTPGL